MEMPQKGAEMAQQAGQEAVNTGTTWAQKGSQMAQEMASGVGK
jgi:hypothetical protein